MSCRCAEISGKLDRIIGLLEGRGVEPPPKRAGIGPPKTPQGIQAGFPQESLRRWGCYFFCLLRWAEEVRGEGFPANYIENLFAQARSLWDSGKPIITDNAFVNNPVRLLNTLSGKKVVSRVSLWTNDGNYPRPSERIFIVREKHPAHGAHFALMIDGERWDSLPPLEGRIPAGFRVLA